MSAFNNRELKSLTEQSSALSSQVQTYFLILKSKKLHFSPINKILIFSCFMTTHIRFRSHYFVRYLEAFAATTDNTAFDWYTERDHIVHIS